MAKKPQADNKVVLDILMGGREMLQRRGVWCQASLVAKGELDGEVRSFESGDDMMEDLGLKICLEGVPHRVCAIGAVYAQPGALVRKSKTTIDATPEGAAAVDLLSASTPLIKRDGDEWHPEIVDYNDDYAKRKAQIIAVYDRAIAKVEAML